MKNKSIVIVLIIVFCILNCSKNREPSQNIDSTQIPNYLVANEKDMSYSGIKRIQVKIKVDGILSESNIKSICNDLIPKYKKNKYYAAIFHFYLPSTEIDDFSDAGIAEWGPNGKWDQAEKYTKNYSNYLLSIKPVKPEPKQPEDFWYKRTGILKAQRENLYNEIVKYKSQGLSTGDACEKVSSDNNVPFAKISDIYAEFASKK